MLGSPRVAYGFAALCLIAAAGASVQLIKLNSRISDLQGPRTNIQFVQVNFEKLRGNAPRLLETDASYHFTLVLDRGTSDRYAVEILRRTPDGEVLEWTTDELSRKEAGANQYLSFVLPRGFLKPGFYAFRFFALAEDRELLGEERFTFRGNAGE